MTPIPADDPLPALTDAIERAEKEVFRLCSGRDRSFRMTVPPEPDRDSDLLLIAGLDAGREALRRLAALQQPAHPEPSPYYDAEGNFIHQPGCSGEEHIGLPCPGEQGRSPEGE